MPSVETSLRLLDKASTSSLAFFPDRLVVESTDYVDFATFQELTRRGVEAIDKLGGPVAVERIGLRYINEIRVPGRIADTRDWTEWVAPALVGIGEVAGAWPVTTLQGVLQYKVGTDRHLIFRYAALPDGSVIGDAPLRRTRAGSGPVFVVDLDCFWQPADGQLPDFVADQVMECVTELHEPIEEAFLYVITERLKDEVLRKEAR
ncbi:hypothetical protein LI90_670 [Carbonactinospora thermoautotrophica]|uniref:TIGR04255 family protein n=1 Tax=Carbonactinospora thermoautotrophica TaxID=1469144 RepID=A0A132MMG5_9ACTN|nr:hypothetical protein LI90_670 [Carbonactinospora thermoautotrophica]